MYHSTIDRMLYALDDGRLFGDEELINRTILEQMKSPGSAITHPKTFIDEVNKRLASEHSRYRLEFDGSGSVRYGASFGGELRLWIRGKEDGPVDKIRVGGSSHRQK